MPHFAAITLDRFIKNGDSRSVNRPNQSKTTVSKVNPTNSKPWDYLRLEKTNSNSVSSTRRRDPDSPSLFPPSPHIIDHTCSIPFVVKNDDSNLKNTIDEAKITAHEKGEGSHAVTSESSSHVWLTTSESITSAHVNGAIISECQYECINLEDGIVGEERNGPTEEDGCEMRESDSEDLCDPHNSMSSCTSHKDGEELDIQVQSSRLATLVPELPSLFPPSPHIIDHKCSTSVVVKKDDASNLKNTTDEAKISVNEKDSRSHGVPPDSSSHVLFTASDSIISGLITNECQFRCINLENGIVGEERNGLIEEDGYEMPATSTLCRENDSEDFCDPHNSMRSCRSHKDGEELNILVQSSRLATPTPNLDVEFYDAWEELSSVQNSAKATLEEELRDVRLSLAMETEKRKQAEESLKNMQRKWERMGEHLSHVGLTLPTWKTETIDFDPSEEVICQQVHVIRFVSDSIGRGIAKAEARTEMEHQLKAKNFEITRLCDRLQYYKLVNHEMSERNQQVAEEGTRCLRERRKWRQRWIWGSIGVTMSIGVVAVACRYLQPPSSCIVGALHYQPTVNSE